VKYVVLASSLLMSCALELPGSGSSGADQASARDPIIETSSAVPADTSASVPPSMGPQPGEQPAAVGTMTTPGATSTSTPTPTPTPTPALEDAGLDSNDAGAPEPPDAIDAGVFTLSSSAFDDGARLPSAFTCRGADDSPPLSWHDAPAEAKSFALVLTSKAARAGASLKVEWVLWGIPATRSSLPEGVAAGRQPSNVASAVQHSRETDASGDFTAGGFTGGSSAGGFGGVSGVSIGVSVSGEAESAPRYRGPCGSSDKQYEFTLFALEAGAPRGASMDVETVEEWLATREHVLGAASLSATFP
jgi:phosphatidylethanolamine-binding protein (PEBP) family uncharacterized protein